MSIYHPHPAFFTPDLDVHWHPVPSRASRAGRHVPPPPDDPRWRALRRAQPAEVLLPRTRRWLASLPEAVCPYHLAVLFARLANRIAADWDTPDACSSFLYCLLTDRRGGRRGFPPAVLKELLALRAYYAATHPVVAGIVPVPFEPC